MKRTYSRFVAYFALLAILAVPVVTLLAACQSLGLATAQTFNQKAAVAYASVTSVRSSALTLLEAGNLTPREASDINTEADNARAAIEAAETLHASDASAGSTKLDAVLNTLTLLENYLTAKKGASP